MRNRVGDCLTWVSFALVGLVPCGNIAQAGSDSDLGNICRAAVAAIMGRDIKIMKLDQVHAGIAQVSYTRPSDHTQWKNQCRVEQDRVIWRTIDAFGPGSGPGPWRSRPEDEVIRFSIDGSRITIIQEFSDGSTSSDVLTIE